ncbi:hypothetical protein SEA_REDWATTLEHOG_90 [Gordonia phage RedWattleHog]|uniref:Uncharacterized protein n=1 Tax=Gordonia phage Stormageddon TaxID=2656541 RepID=A0A649VSM8_9CAUD|nr:hypothetical protein KHQ86_gp213 [Gordonia phage Stormageddon]QGJ94949.1 hypothetical protein SEA_STORMAGEDDON_87 [Gordonia phage Stormageddon]QLF83593.1 hypothetical protein SEA_REDWATTLEHOG_90 [Gordonia phage RedWattleHog]
METRTLIEPSAQVITITTLKPGDTYKRLVKNYSDTYDLRIGVVTDVLNNGSEAVLTALEFSGSYSTAEAELKVFGGDKDLALFATTPEEVGVYLDDVNERAHQMAESKRRELEKAEAVVRAVEDTLARARGGQLSAPVVERQVES